MLSLPDSIETFLKEFVSLFSRPSFKKACFLFMGLMLSRGKRTIASCLRSIGRAEDKDFTNYHRWLNRCSWSSLKGSKLLFRNLCFSLFSSEPMIFLIDETLERRKGYKIQEKGSYRDPVHSDGLKTVHRLGIQWICVSLCLRVPWSKRRWALPFLTLLSFSKQYCEQHKKLYKTPQMWAKQVTLLLSKWTACFPQEKIMIGDGAYAGAFLGQQGLKYGFSWICRIKKNARLHDFVRKKDQKKMGRKRKIGVRLPSLHSRTQDSNEIWETTEVNWYQGKRRKVEILYGKALWYNQGVTPLPILWVLVRQPGQEKTGDAFYSTDLRHTPEQVISYYGLRWNQEVTFEETRAHLGVETQRQWSSKAIRRTTPLLLASYSLITSFFLQENLLSGKLPSVANRASWYPKEQVTFSDLLYHIRKEIWKHQTFSGDEKNQDTEKQKRESIKLEVFLDNLARAA